MTVHAFLRLLAAGLASAALCACVSNAKVVDPDASTTQAAQMAIVIVSASHDRKVSHASASFFLDGGTPDVVKVMSASGHMELPIRNNFHDKYGHVYVLEVKPGHHRFTYWSLTWGNARAAPKVVLTPLEFDVAAGQVVYLGNLHATLVMGKTLLFNRSVPYAASVSVLDQSAADLPIAEAAYPSIAGKARIALLPLGPWGRQVAQSDVVDDLPAASDATPDGMNK